jgi:hypothetical protein
MEQQVVVAGATQSRRKWIAFSFENFPLLVGQQILCSASPLDPF